MRSARARGARRARFSPRALPARAARSAPLRLPCRFFFFTGDDDAARSTYADGARAVFLLFHARRARREARRRPCRASARAAARRRRCSQARAYGCARARAARWRAARHAPPRAAARRAIAAARERRRAAARRQRGEDVAADAAMEARNISLRHATRCYYDGAPRAAHAARGFHGDARATRDAPPPAAFSTPPAALRAARRRAILCAMRAGARCRFRRGGVYIRGRHSQNRYVIYVKLRLRRGVRCFCAVFFYYGGAAALRAKERAAMPAPGARVARAHGAPGAPAQKRRWRRAASARARARRRASVFLACAFLLNFRAYAMRAARWRHARCFAF